MLREISIEIIRKCPNRCLHCSSMSCLESEEIIDYELYKSVIDSASELGVKLVCISGGEPFLHERLPDMTGYAKSLGMEVSIYTSGITLDGAGNYTYISRDALSEIAGNADRLIFNIEAASADTYDYIMGTKGCFELMKQSALNAHALGITTEAHFVPMKPNAEELDGVVSLCKELHISKMNFLRFVPHGRGLENESELVLTDIELDCIRKQLKKTQKCNVMDIRIGIPLSDKSECYRCSAATGKLNIRYDGMVFPCEVFKNERMAGCMGGIKPDSVREHPLSWIYGNSPYLACIRDMKHDVLERTRNEVCMGQYLISKSDYSHK